MNPEWMTHAPPGLAHFVAQADTVGLILLGLLTLMSVVSWVILGTKAWFAWTQGRHGHRFLSQFHQTRRLEDLSKALPTDDSKHNAFTQLATRALQAHCHFAQHSTSAAPTGTVSDFVARTLRSSLDQVAVRTECGLTVLATVGATAPFVGLLGTVWGIYHALLGMGLSGSTGLAQVAGPIGEALVMTALGLAVALPAVVGYNLIGRANRVLLIRLDQLAQGLLNLVMLGRSVDVGTEPLTRSGHGIRAAAGGAR